jgi:hypothetical protein
MSDSDTLTRPRVIHTDTYVAGRRVWVESPSPSADEMVQRRAESAFRRLMHDGPGGRDDPPTAVQFHRAMQGIRFPEPDARA